MTTLRKFIAKKPKKCAFPTIIPPSNGTTPEVQTEYGKKYSRPRELFLYYAAVQQKHGKWVVPYIKDKRMRACFRKLATKLQLFEALGVEIDDMDYILAHKQTYGPELRPQHLISWCSLNIYESYKTAQYAEVLELTEVEQEAYDTETVAYLAQLRGESPEEVARLLMSCDLL